MLGRDISGGVLRGLARAFCVARRIWRAPANGTAIGSSASFVPQPQEKQQASRPRSTVQKPSSCVWSARRVRAQSAALTAVLVLLAPGLSPVVAAPLPANFDSPNVVEYQVVDQDLRQLLVEFGRAHGVVVALTDGVQGRLRGRLPPLPPREFLDTVCRMHGLSWFYDGRHLHVSALTETRSLLIPLNNVDGTRLTRMMRELGLEDARFRARLVGDGTHVAVSGPPGFVDQVEKLVTLLGKEGATEVRVIRGRRGQEGPS